MLRNENVIIKDTPAGNKYINTYQEEIGKDGIKKIVKIGVKNVYDIIQQDLESTKIENILHQVAMGDLRALNQRDITYFDATTMPKNLMDMQNLGLKARSEFEAFPAEVKEMFNNSVDQYMAEMGSKEFFEKMGKYSEKVRSIEEAGNMKAYEKKVAEQAKFENDVAAKKGESAE